MTASADPSGGGRLVVQDIYHLVCGDVENTRLRGVDIAIEDGVIAAIDTQLARPGDEIIDGSTKLVIPGLICAHHHSFQRLQRNLLPVQNLPLFEWMEGLYPVWRHLDPAALTIATQLACAELLKTGCTTVVDQHYLFTPELAEDPVALQCQAANELGIRFYAMRGCMSRGQSQGGMPPDALIQDDQSIIVHSQRLIERLHDPTPRSMRRVGLAPCALYCCTPGLMRSIAELARSYNVGLQTHLGESADENDYCLAHYGCRPLALMRHIGWLGPDVSFAGGVHLNDIELESLAESQTGVVHCATSNMRLGSGVARLPEMLARGVRVGIGVDGGASNDTADMLGELRNCMLLQRAVRGAQCLDASDVLRLATRGSAQVIGWPELGCIGVNRPADLVLIEMNRLDYAGALSDPLAAAIFSGISHGVHTTIVDGQVVVADGKLTQADEAALRDQGHCASRMLLEKAKGNTAWHR